MFLAAVGAGPVYRLLGKKDLGTAVFPPIETPLIDGDIAFRQHSGGHTPGPNWPTFLTFASRYLHTPGGAQQGKAEGASPSPAHLTAEEDRKRTLDLLGLKEADLRRRPAGDANAADATNYDESKAHVYSNLPDPLMLNDGKPVTTPMMWWTERRPQIVDDFNREILGREPANLPKVTWEVVSTTKENYDGAAVVTKRLAGHVDNSSYPQITVNIDMVLTTPADAKGPVPVVMELAFAPDFQKAVARPLPEDPGQYGIPWKPVLERGWGFAILSPTSFQADDGSGLDRRHYRVDEQGAAAQPQRLGCAEGMGLGE